MNLLSFFLRLAGNENQITKTYKSEDISKNGMRDSVVSHLEFTATMQLRTPLAALDQHGTTCAADGSAPPYQPAMADGIWLPALDSRFSALREGATMASDIGPIPHDDTEYLVFLKSIRSIVEKPSDLLSRREELQAMLKNSSLKKFVIAHGGTDSITDKFFPEFTSTISGLPKTSLDNLKKLKYFTPRDISAADDKTLLRIPGIGPAKLAALRLACKNAKNPDARYIAAENMNVF